MDQTIVQSQMCNVTKSHWGYDSYINICTNQVYNVDWTSLDYFGWTALLLLLGTMCVACIVFIINVIFG